MAKLRVPRASRKFLDWFLSHVHGHVRDYLVVSEHGTWEGRGAIYSHAQLPPRNIAELHRTCGGILYPKVDDAQDGRTPLAVIPGPKLVRRQPQAHGCREDGQGAWRHSLEVPTRGAMHRATHSLLPAVAPMAGQKVGRPGKVTGEKAPSTHLGERRITHIHPNLCYDDGVCAQGETAKTPPRSLVNSGLAADSLWHLLRHWPSIFDSSCPSAGSSALVPPQRPTTTTTLGDYIEPRSWRTTRRSRRQTRTEAANEDREGHSGDCEPVRSSQDITQNTKGSSRTVSNLDPRTKNALPVRTNILTILKDVLGTGNVEFSERRINIFQDAEHLPSFWKVIKLGVCSSPAPECQRNPQQIRAGRFAEPMRSACHARAEVEPRN